MQLPLLLLTAAQDPARPFGGAEGPDYSRYLLVCGLVILAVAGGGYAVRRLIGESLKRRAAARSLRILDVLPLGSRQRLCVVQCYDRTFVLGQGDKEVRLVAELDPVTVQPAPESRGRGTSLPDSFRALLERTQGQIGRARVQGGQRRPEGPRGPLPRIEELA